MRGATILRPCKRCSFLAISFFIVFCAVSKQTTTNHVRLTSLTRSFFLLTKHLLDKTCTVDVNMTVEDYISVFVEHLKNSIRDKNNESKAKLDMQLENAKRQLFEAHREVLNSVKSHHKPINDEPTNDGLSIQTSVDKTTSSNRQPQTVDKVETAMAESKGIRVEILSGPHSGATFLLDPRPRAPCFLGRSAGKKFTERGISLSSDLEVSTTHGKFELKKGLYFYIDQSSTNGSYYKDKMIEPFQAIELVDGMVLTVGTSDLKISL